jgi:hypothetical protein
LRFHYARTNCHTLPAPPQAVGSALDKFVRVAAPLQGVVVMQLVHHANKLHQQLKQQPNQVGMALSSVCLLR